VRRLAWIPFCLGLLLGDAAQGQSPPPPRRPPGPPLPPPAGQACTSHSPCGLGRCETFVEGGRFCTGRGKLCSIPGEVGADPAEVIEWGGRCYECRQGLGWRPC
jgi:hypothetical protein